MSDELQNAATIASLRAEVERLTAELQGEREDLAACYKAKATLIDERNACLRELDFARAENVRLTNEAATARERAGVLEAEVKAWHAAEHLRKDEPHNEFMRLAEARAETDLTHALDAAKFGGATLARNQPCGCVVCLCEDDERCQGCGAKHCGTHPVGEIPNQRFGGAT